MNVRIFWVCVMKCMCAQTRPRFILSSERVFGGMEFEPMLTPREKSPLPENVPRGGSNPRRCGQRAQTLPTSYSGPLFRMFCSKQKQNKTEKGVKNRWDVNKVEAEKKTDTVWKCCVGVRITRHGNWPRIHGFPLEKNVRPQKIKGPLELECNGFTPS